MYGGVTMPDAMNLSKEKAFLERCAEEKKIPGGVFAFVTREEEQVFSFGYRSVIDEPQRLSEEALFDLASLTKVVCTTTVALQCLERGEFALETPVSEFLPDFPHGEVTMGNLLTHTSGICGDDKEYKKCRTKNELLDFFWDKPLNFQPGEKVEYSDFGYILLGHILEKIVGRLDEYASSHIFQPLEMEDTCFNPADRGWERRCVPTELTEERGLVCGQVHDGKAWRMGGVSGNAGLFSTAGDLSRFVKMMLNDGRLAGEQILSGSTIRLLQRCYTEGLNERRTLGWIAGGRRAQMGDYYSSKCLFHTGFTGTSIYIDFQRKCGVVLLTNRIHPDRSNTAIFEIRRRLHNLTLIDFDNTHGEAFPDPNIF